MRHTLLRLCLGSSLIGLALLAGCNHSRRQCNCGCETIVSSGPAVNAGDANAMAASNLRPVVQPTQLPDFGPPPTSEVVQAVHVPPPPPVEQPKPAVAESGIQQVGYVAPLTGGKEASVRRRTFTDITADPRWDHAPDYTWLIGELQYLHGRNVWRVRYASCEDEDRFGGSVTLCETGPMSEFKEGMTVRVEGRVLNEQVTDRAGHSEYRVNAIQAVN
jgi:hypothetical protein